MQSIQKLTEILENITDSGHYIFTPQDFCQILPDLTGTRLTIFLGRMVKAGFLEHVCRGIYLYPKAPYPKGCELYHTAARLRCDTFCYLSLESVLSEHGIISQIPLGWITLMTSGRAGIFDCGKWGSIEFIHTKKDPAALCEKLHFDARYKLWCASVPLALQDMKAAKRQTDLIDWEAAGEFI
jgi:hypothetical protein